MNEFTKDELRTLLKCARLIEIDFGECENIAYIIFKIKSMIDNYCEHEWGGVDNHFCIKCKNHL